LLALISCGCSKKTQAPKNKQDTAKIGLQHKSTNMLRYAADGGDAEAQCVLGDRYRIGDGVERNLSEAAKWYLKSAVSGFARAQFMLGGFYEREDGVEKNLQEAAKWYQKAAEQGYAKAQVALGHCYEGGYGVEKDLKAALEWYHKAAV